ncbi:MAG: hypothetical protein ACRDF4_04230 [Rhabdochlamydiaceae bacterium]
MNSKWFIAGAAVIVIALGGLWWYQASRPVPLSQASDSNAGTEQQSPAVSVSQVQPSASATGSVAVSGAKISYTQALNLYVGKRMQFDQNCVAIPNDVTYKRGTTIMFDNRADSSRLIKLDGTPYRISAYDYILVTLTTSFPLPHTIAVDCGSGENTANIYLQQ